MLTIDKDYIMASNMQNHSPLPESQVQKEQFVADENQYKETHQQSVLLGAKQRKALVSIENILPQSAVVIPETVKSTRPRPPVGIQSVMLEDGGKRSHKRPAESVAIAGSERSKKRLRRL